MSPPFAHRLRVRYSECDAQGAVFNANYLTYFDVAITELWREAIGRYDEMTERGVDMVVAEASIRYLAPVRFDDEVDVEVEIERLGTTSMVTRLAVVRAGERMAEGRLRHVFIDVGTRAKTDIPEPVRAALVRYLAPDGPDARMAPAGQRAAAAGRDG